MANYLYNGVELPDINEVWTDEETYPYGAIIHPATDTTQIRFVANDRKIKMLSNGVAAFYIGQYISFLFKDGEWVKLGDGITMGYPFWCSEDIYNEDGTLYLAASVPVPVTTLDPKSMLDGWLVGRRIAGMRGKA